MALNTSVVITVLNEAQTIVGLLNALIDQSVLPTEVLIVDGGSHDATIEIIKKYQQRQLQFKLVLLQKKGNRSVGRNYGIEQAANEVIAITDAGCVPHKDWLEKLLVAHHNHRVPVIAGYYDAQPQTAFEAAVVPYVLVMPDRINPQNFLPATRSMLVEKSTWSLVGKFDETLSDNEDYAFAHQLRKHQVPIAFTDQAKVTWIPRSNLLAFWWMIFRFARGDIQAGIIRKKVLAVFIRYLVILILISYLALTTSPLLWPLILMAGLSYSLWAILKNYHYARSSWLWLPVLQFAADLAVMVGSLVGHHKQ